MNVPTFETMPTIAAQRVSLRPLTSNDANDLFRIFGDAEVMRFWSSPPWQDVADAHALIENVTRGAAENQFYQWGVAHNDEDTVIGTCTLFQLDRRNRRAEIGFILRRDCWGQGFMTEALGALLQFSFETMKLHRLEADVDPRNEACIRLLERVGFQREGLLRERWLVNGEVNDSLMLGLLRGDFQTGSSEMN